MRSALLPDRLKNPPYAICRLRSIPAVCGLQSAVHPAVCRPRSAVSSQTLTNPTTWI
jgi:hypothetical protein